MNTILLNVDWLTINYTIPLAIENVNELNGKSEFSFVSECYTTRHFRNVTRVERGKEELFILTHNPFSKIIQPNLVQVKISNKLFYWGCWLQELKKLKQFLNLSFQSISRIDVCADWEGYNPNEFIDLIRSGKVRMKSPKKISEFYNIEKGELKHEGIKFGSPVSSYTFKIYNKSKEIEEESFKYYIWEWWEWNWKKAIEKDVFRFEFSITELPKIAFSTGELINDENIFEFVYQKELLQLYIDKMRFYYYTGKCRQDREKQYDLLPQTQEQAAKSLKYASTGINTRTAKVVCNSLVFKLRNSKLSNSEAYNIYKTIKSVVTEYHLHEWYFEKHKEDDEFIWDKYSFTIMGTGMKIATNLFREEFRILDEREINFSKFIKR